MLAALLFPVLALNLVVRVEVAQLVWPLPKRTTLGWIGLAGCLACGAAALWLLRESSLHWPALLVAAVSYGAGVAVTAGLIVMAKYRS